MIVAVTSRGSQVHQVFQIGRAQIDPLTMFMKVKTTPILIPAMTATCQIGDARHRRDQEGECAHPARRNVEVKHPLHIPHHGFTRGVEKHHVERRNKQQAGESIQDL